MRVFVFGIDSATFDIILPLVERGEMPVMADLMKRGAWGNLMSTHPPMTPPAWASFMTGRNPENHGMFDFYDNKMEGAKYKRRLVTSADIKCHNIFDIVGFHKMQSLVVGMPMTYPPLPLDGALISGFMTPSEDSAYTYPKELKKELLASLGNYVMDAPLGRRKEDTDEEGHIKENIAADRSKVQATHYLLDKYDRWRLATIVFSSVDKIQHHFWKYINPEHPEYESPNGGKYRGAIDEFHRRLDEYLGGFLERLTPEDTVLIVSDHGAGGVGAVFYPDKWLEDNGYLRNNIRIQMKNEFKSHYRSLSNSVRRLLGYQPGLWKKLKKRRLYEKTLAFCGNASEMGIYLNVKEKRTAGVVNSGLEYEAVRDEIISGLSEITDPRSGGRVFEWIKPREEVHDGLHSDAAPDIVFKPASGYMVYPGCPDEMFDYGSDLSGWHEPEGILIACGPAIKEDYQLQEAHIADIAPTILYLMGLPIDSKMDGRLLNEIISDDCITSRPPEYFEYSDLYNEAGAGTAYDEDEARIVEEKLKGLGYL